MKWFFAVTQDILNTPPQGSEQNYSPADCIRVAVQSARENTSLSPHMVFDGEPCDFTDEMEEAGVKVIFHRLQWYDRLQEVQQRQKPEWPDYMHKAASAFTPLELPLLETEAPYVLYTSYDVIFLKDPKLEFYKPEIFAAGSQLKIHHYYADMSSGVMLINLKRFERDREAMIEFMCDNFAYIAGYEQELLRIFYNGNWSPLSPKFNWKAYWKSAEDPFIFHFYGITPYTAQALLDDPEFQAHDQKFQAWRHLFFENPNAYAHYLLQWEQYLKKAKNAENIDESQAQIADFDSVRG